MPEEPVVAIALLTQTNLRMLKGALTRVFPITEDGRFDALLKALDEREAAEASAGTRPQ